MSEKQTESRHRKTFVFTLARGVFWLLSHTVTPVRYEGAEKLNREGPWILISNHVSGWDPMVVGSPVKCQEIVFLGKKELTRNPIGGWVVKKLHMISVDRHSTDMEAMRACIRALKEGEVLGFFPEGTRHHEGVMQTVESGIALIALRAKVPMRPVYVDRPLRLFRVTRVRVGDEIPTADLSEAGINQDTISQLIARIQESYRGLTEKT
ncbi:MAG: 1-acyl-sn-glycerol-3-phosphate acyltransferase [Clostridia bacterium]|nr:1-acyl-sn-glycerol-3-phosphate acyltransferase [Clostridia bacterium]